ALLLVACGGAEDSATGESATGADRPGAEARSDRGGDSGGERSGRSRGGRRGGPPGAAADDGDTRGVPVEVVEVGRRPIALFFETQGVLEAENEVDLVSRVAGPIVQLEAEEGDRVRKGQLLAKIDDREITTQLDVARVRLQEAEQSYRRVESLHEKELVARDAYDQALAAFESARGEVERLDVQLAYTRITAPFSGLVVRRYVRFAEHVQNGAGLFRLSDFDPLLAPIRVPERELRKLAVDQRAELTVEAWGERRFDARVLRIRPVVDAETGTVEVTLEVDGDGELRPGMFANVYLEMDRREQALVVPRTALALDSLGDTVFAVTEADGGTVASRRDLELGFRNDRFLEVLGGIAEGERVVTVGQDGLSEGTPIEVLAVDSLDGERVEEAPSRSTPPAAMAGGGGPGGERGGPPGGRRGMLRNLDLDDPEQVERVKTMMRQRGLSDDEIDERLERMRQRREQMGGGGQ
ncbi:MAG: efflux RND transporter periplasmic adaptor subunit, partial [Acidobacteriota bacterium]